MTPQALLITELYKKGYRTACGLFQHVSFLPNVFLSSFMLLQVAVVHSFSRPYNYIVCEMCHTLVIHFPASGHLPHSRLSSDVK